MRLRKHNNIDPYFLTVFYERCTQYITIYYLIFMNVSHYYLASNNLNCVMICDINPFNFLTENGFTSKKKWHYSQVKKFKKYSQYSFC